MFNNDVTKNYSHQDATSEILIMLVGAFLLGYLMCWLFNKLFRANKYQNNTASNLSSDTYRQTSDENKYVPQTTGKARVVKNTIDKPYSTPRTDNLTKISGITSNVQSNLKREGINSFTDLRDIKTQSLKSIQDSLNSEEVNKKEIETWPHQASLAAKGDWHKLREYQTFISRSQKATLNVGNQPPVTKVKADDLKVIEGIGPKIEEILNAKDISTFKELSDADTVTLKNYIVDADERFNKNETESWPHQAAMADKGQWEELNIYQEFMHSETMVDPDVTDSSEKDLDNRIDADSLNDYDDLKKIEGIGPKIEEVLNKSGIYTFSQLSNSNRDRLYEILSKAGSQYKMHDPESWPRQANMAHRKDWKELKEYQQSLQTAGTNDLVENSKKLDTDDLKKIEGIGPKIQELLNNADITTFSKLSKQTRDYLKGLLDEGGPQYRVHEPESWPLQAKLAKDGKWDELQKLQDELIGGRK